MRLPHIFTAVAVSVSLLGMASPAAAAHTEPPSPIYVTASPSESSTLVSPARFLHPKWVCHFVPCCN